MRWHKKSPINLAPPGLDENLLQDLDSVKLIPPNDPKLLAAKRLLNDAEAAMQRAEESRLAHKRSKLKKLGKKVLKSSNGTA